MAKEVKMQDIAQRLGVSTMTVSKALAGKGGVSDQTRMRVKEMAIQMGYITLASGKEIPKKSYNIGVLLSEYYADQLATFYWKMYQNISTSAVSRNCFVMLEMIPVEDEKQRRIPKLIQENKADGLMILGSMESEYLRMVKANSEVPVVYMDFYDSNISEDSVISNSFYGSYQITDYLFQKGHRKIAYVGRINATMSITDRYLGYEKALIEHGIEIRPEWIIPDRGEERSSYDLIELPEEMPTAFVCNCDLTASTLIRSLNEAGYSVPGDVSVVGYDDWLHPGRCDIAITSYGVDMEGMAIKGICLLIDKIEGNPQWKGLQVVEGYLVERDSVKAI